MDGWRFHAMSEEQLSALLAKLLDDEGLQEKFKGAADLDDALAMAQEAGFAVSKADWLKYQAKQTLELSDEDLESVSAGGTSMMVSVIPLICDVMAPLIEGGIIKPL